MHKAIKAAAGSCVAALAIGVLAPAADASTASGSAQAPTIAHIHAVADHYNLMLKKVTHQVHDGVLTEREGHMWMARIKKERDEKVFYLLQLRKRLS